MSEGDESSLVTQPVFSSDSSPVVSYDLVRSRAGRLGRQRNEGDDGKEEERKKSRLPFFLAPIFPHAHLSSASLVIISKRLGDESAFS